MGSATFFDAFNALSLAFALPTLIRLWHISPRQSGLLISASYVGQLAGALVFSALAEKIGRIRGTTAAIAIMSIMSFGCALAGNFPALLACRLVQGIGVGGEMPVAATYINELSRAHGRGRFFLLYEMIFPLGLMATGQIGAWLVPAYGWNSIFLLGGIPGLLITFLVARLPESPRWLISKGRIQEAEAIVEQIEASTSRRVPVATTTSDASTASLMQRGRWSELLSSTYRGRTLIVWALWASAFFIANGLNNWMPSLYNTVYHLSLRQSLRAASMTNVAQVAVLFVCAFSIDRIGRRNWTVAAFVLGGGMLALSRNHGSAKSSECDDSSHAGLRPDWIHQRDSVSLHAGNLSHPHASDWNGPSHVMAANCVGRGPSARRFHGRCQRHPFRFLDVRRDQHSWRVRRNLHGRNKRPSPRGNRSLIVWRRRPAGVFSLSTHHEKSPRDAGATKTRL